MISPPFFSPFWLDLRSLSLLTALLKIVPSPHISPLAPSSTLVSIMTSYEACDVEAGDGIVARLGEDEKICR